MYTVISYDIKSDKRRCRIHKALKNYGEWVQFSVFECNLNKQQYLGLRERLRGLIKKEEGDNIRFYFLCDGCVKNIERVGGIKPRENNEAVII